MPCAAAPAVQLLVFVVLWRVMAGRLCRISGMEGGNGWVRLCRERGGKRGVREVGRMGRQVKDVLGE